MELFKVNRGLTYVYNPYAEENKFLHMPVENNPFHCMKTARTSFRSLFGTDTKIILNVMIMPGN